MIFYFPVIIEAMKIFMAVCNVLLFRYESCYLHRKFYSIHQTKVFLDNYNPSNGTKKKFVQCAE
jgi:hypothetical protein